LSIKIRLLAVGKGGAGDGWRGEWSTKLRLDIVDILSDTVGDNKKAEKFYSISIWNLVGIINAWMAAGSGIASYFAMANFASATNSYAGIGCFCIYMQSIPLARNSASEVLDLYIVEAKHHKRSIYWR
jgi:hypothetical protein